jgi:hypothetical protein
MCSDWYFIYRCKRYGELDVNFFSGAKTKKPKKPKKSSSNVINEPFKYRLIFIEGKDGWDWDTID